MATYRDSKIVARIKDFLPSKSTFKFEGRPPNLPFGICLFFLLAAKGYSTFRFILSSRASRDYFHYVDQGWISARSYKDYGDMEWIFWKQQATETIGFMLARAALKQLLRGFNRASDILLAFDLVACTCLLGFGTVFFHLILTCVFFLVALAKVRLLIWALAAVLCICRYIFPMEALFDEGNVWDRFRFECTACFLVARCVSFGFDYVDSLDASVDERPLQTLVSFAKYNFFYPCFLVGPIIPYNTFCEKISAPRITTNKQLLGLCGNVLGGIMLYELGSHIHYPFSTRYDRHYVQTTDLWSLAGNSFALGRFFYYKYVVLYGIAGFFTIINGVDYAQIPICTSWCHRYSLMWQWFDHGLYVFLKRYIYIPFAKKNAGKVFSSMGCFVFILFWHGFSKHITCWIILNWTLLLLEGLVYKYFKNQHLQAVFNSPLIVGSLLSNMFFLGENYNYGFQLLRRLLLQNSATGIFTVFFIGYCWSFTGEYFRIWTKHYTYPRVKTSKVSPLKPVKKPNSD